MFLGLTILLHDLDNHQLPSIKSKIISMGGVAVNTSSYRGKIDYVVVPIVFNEKSLSIKATIVSCLWIVSILYYIHFLSFFNYLLLLGRLF